MTQYNVKVFDSQEWFKTGDVGDNSKFWKLATIIEEEYETSDGDIVVDVMFEDGRISRGHFKSGIKYLEKNITV